MPLLATCACFEQYLHNTHFSLERMQDSPIKYITRYLSYWEAKLASAKGPLATALIWLGHQGSLEGYHVWNCFSYKQNTTPEHSSLYRLYMSKAWSWEHLTCYYCTSQACGCQPQTAFWQFADRHLSILREEDNSPHFGVTMLIRYFHAYSHSAILLPLIFSLICREWDLYYWWIDWRFKYHFQQKGKSRLSRYLSGQEFKTINWFGMLGKQESCP